MKNNNYIKWLNYSKQLIRKMKRFDKEYMIKNKEHKCESREDFDDGSWYCNHLINARLRSFKEGLKKERKLFYNILKC